MTRTRTFISSSWTAIARGFVVVLLSVAALAAGGSRSTSSAPKTVHVHEYTRKNGTVVKAYDRAAPGTAQHRATSTSKSSTTRPSASASGGSAKSTKTPPTVKPAAAVR
jgi:hypothetical protein